MNVTPEEQLSALLDGELSGHETEFLVRRVARDDSLKARALRYCLIGDALRDELPRGGPVDLVGRVRDEIGAVPAPGRPRRAWGRMAAGVGVAASVALLALVSLPGSGPEVAPASMSSSEVAAPAAVQPQAFGPAYARTASSAPDRLTRYYLNHAEYSPLMGGRSALSRIVVRSQPENLREMPRVQPVNAPR